MYRSIPRFLCATLAACLGGATGAHADGADRWEAPAPSAQVGTPDLRAVWDDPVFQRSFVAGYGVNPEVEPRISQDDMALLELVRQLMPDELPAAEALLRDSISRWVGCSTSRNARTRRFATTGARSRSIRTSVAPTEASG
jgi:hypothetical protein